MGYNSLKTFVIGTLAAVLVIDVLAAEAGATPFFYQGFTTGHVTSTEFDSDWVLSWPSVGDKVNFDYTFACLNKACNWPDNSMVTSISVPAFSGISYETTSDYNYPEVSYDAETMEVGYNHPFDAAIPDDWFRMRLGVEYFWWQEILTVQGTLGGGWTGSVYYYYQVIDWDNELFDTIEGKFTFVTEPIPEPTTILLFGSGLVGLVGSRLRKKKQQ